MTTPTNEADVIFNRANIALARSQRLVASWLPPKSDEELAQQTKSEEELQREEDEIFTAVPEKLGLGAPLPKATEDGSWNRTELSSNDKLRQQLMGKGFAKAMAAKQRQLQQNINRRPEQGKAGAKSSARTENDGGDDDDDEEEGRSALGNKKRKVAATVVEDGANNEIAESKESSASTPGAESGRGKKKKKTGSYLDEVLSQRSKKKKK
ncbi:hypothetical protein C8Q69DRAFT_322707 [Paecilomyces variotii]|uniref:Uncharacterized protein n=1 Tax=Byssochlamys spectabilis TaxID=264951 RepID=A0A443HR50_BYSSP|nr:hypothetical protein C8Q69DRAFT_322707 [Paecilomyces variotii]KAJ9229713.1 hypothetical protein DTO169E5_8787 [Paecilomyces variotii]KAJ9249415.1 hypothetical protein DTO195F2_8526 [Paecilomyces variotii]KAJ9284595.1 hypothetical protein DTO021C3_7826 [Paecilomyces variotii]KAJ9363181.1 hypothetical protein DTO280E4_2930 [Paecilomyces variotii]RWQ94287.1 hypothetical protein C8Q69DRAFT_322707 [Paecilomyces variotii]